MRTTIDIPDELFDEAKKLLGFKSKTDLVIYSLEEVIRKKKLQELADLAGKVQFQKTAPQLRGKTKK
jgi:Arc/MetJ family transcription regulator